MIDLDRMEQQLALAVTEVAAPVPAPAPSPGPGPTSPAARRPPVRPLVPAPARGASPGRRQRPVDHSRPAPAPAPAPVGPGVGVGELLALGLLEEADARIAAASDRGDVVTWATMRALLDGRRDAVRTGLDELHALAGAGDARALDRYRAQRFWAAFEWGGEEERYDVLDHCRDRAYRFDDLQWWGNLTLLLAAMGKADEATRAFDATQALLKGAGDDALLLDVVTNCLEAATLLGDGNRTAAAHRSLRCPEGPLVVVGQGVVCKGSVDRYRALGHLALGNWGEADGCFRRAEATHRAIGARPLLDRTLQQASGSRVAA